MENLPSIKQLTEMFSIAPTKKLGQNFLFDQNITDKIASFTKIEDENILEIGPGPGGLTRSILKNNPKFITLIEPDSRCIEANEYQFNELNFKNYKILNADARKIDLQEIYNKQEFTVIANLPYNVGTEILVNCIKQHKYIKSMVLMFQKEVAERITALHETKDYGRISILAQNFYEASLVYTLSPKAFFPAPKIYSSVVKLVRRKEPLLDCDIEKLEKVVQILFAQRRKQIRKALFSIGFDQNSITNNLQISGNERVEDLEIKTVLNIVKHAVL